MMDAQNRPETAIPLHLPLWIETEAPADGSEALSGYAVAIGWDRPQNTTFYLVSSPTAPRPVWISEDQIAGNSVQLPR